MSGLLEGKVAIVTGAARGLGREEALALARLGSRVVVNDLGVMADGSGRDEEAARAVVDEIRSFGGEAVPQFGDVADWNDARSLIQTALDQFGSLEILINNAGFLRDRMIFNMSEEDFDSVVRVHLKGHFCTLRLATAHWRERSKSTGSPVYGRILSTASEAALFGSPGQPNYAAAKAGIVALTMGAAQAMLRYGVTANVIMPRARTRMTDSGITAELFAKPEQGFDTFSPANVAPFAAYLASPLAERISGQLFIVYGTQVTVVGRPTLDTRFESTESWTAASLHEQLGPHFEKLEPVKDGFAVPAF
ncbi:MAG: SDR family NAD(P)-dependent oxidoreductase [Myxococcota bacterium]